MEHSDEYYKMKYFKYKAKYEKEKERQQGGLSFLKSIKTSITDKLDSRDAKKEAATLAEKKIDQDNATKKIQPFVDELRKTLLETTAKNKELVDTYNKFIKDTQADPNANHIKAMEKLLNDLNISLESRKQFMDKFRDCKQSLMSNKFWDTCIINLD